MSPDEREILRAQREEAEQRARRLYSLLQASEAECAALREAVGVLEGGRLRLQAECEALLAACRALVAWRREKGQGAPLVKAVELAEGAVALCEGG
jgi:putative heme degradation protein